MIRLKLKDFEMRNIPTQELLSSEFRIYTGLDLNGVTNPIYLLEEHDSNVELDTYEGSTEMVESTIYFAEARAKTKFGYSKWSEPAQIMTSDNTPVNVFADFAGPISPPVVVTPFSSTAHPTSLFPISIESVKKPSNTTITSADIVIIRADGEIILTDSTVVSDKGDGKVDLDYVARVVLDEDSIYIIKVSLTGSNDFTSPYGDLILRTTSGASIKVTSSTTSALALIPIDIEAIPGATEYKVRVYNLAGDVLTTVSGPTPNIIIPKVTIGITGLVILRIDVATPEGVQTRYINYAVL